MGVLYRIRYERPGLSNNEFEDDLFESEEDAEECLSIIRGDEMREDAPDCWIEVINYWERAQWTDYKDQEDK